jgi:hypothetical protein
MWSARIPSDALIILNSERSADNEFYPRVLRIPRSRHEPLVRVAVRGFTNVPD